MRIYGICFCIFLSTFCVGAYNHPKFKTKENLKVLLLGNSMTFHTASEKIGWIGNWGMAASSEDKDFVHLLKVELLSKYKKLDFRYYNVANTFEKNYQNIDITNYTNFRNFEPDILIIRLGDNIQMDDFNAGSLKVSLENLVKFIDPKSKVFISSRFWSNQVIDNTIKECANKNKWIFVDISSLGEISENMSGNRFENKGVGMHPSDLGMQRIKDKIWEKLKHI